MLSQIPGAHDSEKKGFKREKEAANELERQWEAASELEGQREREWE